MDNKTLTKTEFPTSPRKLNGLTNEPVFYANITSIYATQDDLTMVFGLIDPEDITRANNVARVYMSHRHAQSLYELLAVTLGRVSELKEQSEVNIE
jgi:hypothetical protein